MPRVVKAFCSYCIVFITVVSLLSVSVYQPIVQFVAGENVKREGEGGRVAHQSSPIGGTINSPSMNAVLASDSLAFIVAR